MSPLLLARSMPISGGTSTLKGERGVGGMGRYHAAGWLAVGWLAVGWLAPAGGGVEGEPLTEGEPLGGGVLR